MGRTMASGGSTSVGCARCSNSVRSRSSASCRWAGSYAFPSRLQATRSALGATTAVGSSCRNVSRSTTVLRSRGRLASSSCARIAIRRASVRFSRRTFAGTLRSDAVRGGSVTHGRCPPATWARWRGTPQILPGDERLRAGEHGVPVHEHPRRVSPRRRARSTQRGLMARSPGMSRAGRESIQHWSGRTDFLAPTPGGCVGPDQVIPRSARTPRPRRTSPSRRGSRTRHRSGASRAQPRTLRRGGGRTRAEA